MSRKRTKLRKCPCCTGGAGGGADAARAKGDAQQQRQWAAKSDLLDKFRARMTHPDPQDN